ncbi:MAG: hypothetical protein ACRD5H_10220 [Nitrososphaerales archaeon]
MSAKHAEANGRLMDPVLIIGLVAIAISLVGIGLLFWVYTSLNSELNTTSREILDRLQQTTSELSEVKSSVDNSHAQIISQQSKIDFLSSTNRNLLGNLSRLEDKVSLLEQRLASLENSFHQRNPASPPVPMLSGKATIYGQVLQSSHGFNATERLLATGMDVEYATMPIRNLNADIVLLLSFDWDYQFSSEEIEELQRYVHDGGRLIIAVDTDYGHCNPVSECSMEVARNFGFAFGDDIYGIVTPAQAASTHPIWTTPHSVSSASISFDAYITEILDTDNVKVLGIVDSGISQLPGQIDPRNSAAIVVNENPAFNGGKVLGTGYNVLVGVNGDFRMLDNIVAFMLD